MIINRLIVPEGNKLEFNVEHHENDKLYELAEGELYYIKISDSVDPFTLRAYILSQNSHFSFPLTIEEGEYVFEIGILDERQDSRIILPALDERHRPLNQLLILRRLEY
ncbi:MAG: hypothetical protein IKW03_02070 [Clostridia bacterium]|nr:hypothetical protein [Clostridia bacterium]